MSRNILRTFRENIKIQKVSLDGMEGEAWMGEAWNGGGMAVTTLRQITHTEIDDSFKSEFLGALGSSPKYFCLALIRD